MSLIGMYRGSVACAGTKPRAFTSTPWHVRAARDFSGKQFVPQSTFPMFRWVPYKQNGARSASYRTVATLEARVSDVTATHTGHHALNIITTHSYIKTHTNTADGIGVHTGAQQQVAKDWASSSSIHTDTPRSALRSAPHALSLCEWFDVFLHLSLFPESCLWKTMRGKKADVLEMSFLVSQLAFVWTLTSMLVSHLCIIVHADMSITDWIVCWVSLFGIF